MNDAQKTMAGIGIEAAQSGDPLGSMVQRASDFYRLEPGQAYVQSKTFMKDEPDIVLYQRMYNDLRAKVYNGEPLSQEETDAVTYLHKKMNPGYEQRKGKYDDLITRGKTTIDDIAGQAEGMLESLSDMQSIPLDIPERQPSGDLPGVLEEMRGQFPFEQDVNAMVPRVPFNEEAVMTPERKAEWQEYMQQLMMRGSE